MKTKFAIAAAMFFCSFAAMKAQVPTTPTTEPTPKTEVGKRAENQHDRIQQGVKSGELTHKEARTLNAQERAIHQQTAAERKLNGGKLTKGERKQINAEQNTESKRIYRKKHNAVKTTPKG